MRPARAISCFEHSCRGVDCNLFQAPEIDVDPGTIRIMMVSECAPASPKDFFYSRGKSLFAQTTVQAFQDAGEDISSVDDILKLGVYLTTAIKCPKEAYSIEKETIQNCSVLLEREIALFPNIVVLLLMGDVAIYSINYIAKKKGGPRPVPSGSTYKIRGGKYTYDGRRVFPSYLQAGPGFYIEKSKRSMIAEDIAEGLKLMRSRRQAKK